MEGAYSGQSLTDTAFAESDGEQTLAMPSSTGKSALSSIDGAEQPGARIARPRAKSTKRLADKHPATEAFCLLDWDGLGWSSRTVRAGGEAQACTQFATPSFTPSSAALAQLLIARYRFWLSPNAQAEELRLAGIAVPRSILARLLQRAAAHLAPLADTLRTAMLESDLIAAANHHVGLGHSQRLWVYVAMPSMVAQHKVIRRGAVAAFRLTPDRQGGYAVQELAAFQGHLFCQRDRGYDALLAQSRISRVGCWNEIRAMLQKLDPTGSHPVGRAVLQTADMLAAMENDLRDETPDRRLRQRQERAPRQLERLHQTLLNARRDASTPDSLRRFTMALLDDWEAYTALLEDGRVTMSCPVASDMLDRYGERHGWVFGKDRDSHAALANMATILETCRLNGVDASHYLISALTRDEGSRWPLPWLYS